jgi:primary-amine oxidase
MPKKYTANSTDVRRNPLPAFSRRRSRFGAGLLRLAVCWLAIGSSAAAQDAGVAHPLDPLSKEEIAAAAQTLKASGKVTEAGRFATIVLREPPKAEVLNFKPGAPMRREAFAVVYERASNKTFEAVVDLKNRSVQSWKEIPGAQPSYLSEDIALTQSIVTSDPQWQAAMRRRGITEFDKVQVDPWPAGYFGFPDEEGVRVVRGVSFHRGDLKNPYARPIEGVLAYVNLNSKKLIKVVDTGVVPVPKASAELDMKSVGQLRAAPKPLEISQPQGVSFETRGHEVSWQNWRFRYALHPREGLVLYTVSYEDQGKTRQVLYRGSLSEMVVPYGDPSATWFFRSPFDAGEAGIGGMAISLEPQIDAPGNSSFFNALFADDLGGAKDLSRAVALYERDGGVLWKHLDYATNHNESRRARQLVLSFFANVGNYEYGFNWVFHQDGVLEMEVLLTGIMSVKGVQPLAARAEAGGNHNNHDGFGHLVADGVLAVHHQHFFNFRLDLDVDGSSNTAVEQNTEALPPGPNNPYHNAFVMKETTLRREREAQRQLNLASNRRWRVINPSVKNALGQPVGYLLSTGENSVPYAGPNSSARKRAAFMNAHLWVTQYEPGELNAAGYYINQSKGGEGLPKWTRANRAIENQDIVLWYSMGVTHQPRPEEWPVMPVHRAGFKLMPSGFFARNPALDLPKPEADEKASTRGSQEQPR